MQPERETKLHRDQTVKQLEKMKEEMRMKDEEEESSSLSKWD